MFLTLITKTPQCADCSGKTDVSPIAASDIITALMYRCETRPPVFIIHTTWILFLLISFPVTSYKSLGTWHKFTQTGSTQVG